MSKDLVNAPIARSWRDIPQPVKPRTMSREGRWRLTKAGLRAAGAVTVIGVLAWGGWMVTGVLQENPGQMPAAAKAVPVSQLALTTDGVLDRAWLAHELALPKNASLMELDLQKLRARLLADGQVSAATLTRSFPATLEVQLAERSPVARLKSDSGAVLLVARDGVTFEGAGFDRAMVELLPWLDGFRLARTEDRKGFKPIEGMGNVAELLAKVRLEADHLYRSWMIVSLARLQSDGLLEVRTKEGSVIVFGGNGDFFRQIARLDFILEKRLGTGASRPANIDLSLGGDVPVSDISPTGAAEARGKKTPPAAPARAAVNPLFSPIPSKPKT